MLEALCYDPTTDELVDLFPGSGLVSAAAAQPTAPTASTPTIPGLFNL